MSANRTKPRNSASSLSKREKMRRKPFSRRQTFDFVAPLVYLPVVHPGFPPGLEWRNDGCEAEVECQLACRVPFPVHHQRRSGALVTETAQQLAPLRRVVRLSGGEREGHGRPGIRGNRAWWSSRLGRSTGVQRVPSGCTLRWCCPGFRLRRTISPLQLLEHPVSTPLFDPVHARWCAVAVPGRQPPPLAAMLGHVEDGVEHLQVRQADVAALHLRGNAGVLIFRDLHPRMITRFA